MLKDGKTMSQSGVFGPKEVPMLGGVPKRCPYESVTFCSCWPPLPHYRSGVPGTLLTAGRQNSSREIVVKLCYAYQLRHSGLLCIYWRTINSFK